MKCIVVWNLITDKMEFFWWCSTTTEYLEMHSNLAKLYSGEDYEIYTEYESSNSNYDHAAGYQN